MYPAVLMSPFFKNCCVTVSYLYSYPYPCPCLLGETPTLWPIKKSMLKHRFLLIQGALSVFKRTTMPFLPIRWNPNTLTNQKEYVETQIFIDPRSSQCFQKNDNATPSKQLTLCTAKLSSKYPNHASQANSSTSFISLSYGRHWTSYCNHSSHFNNFLLISCSVIFIAFSVTLNVYEHLIPIFYASYCCQTWERGNFALNLLSEVSTSISSKSHLWG